MFVTWFSIIVLGLISVFLRDINYYNEEIAAFVIIFLISIVIIIELFFLGKKRNTREALIILIGYIIRVFLLFWDIYAQDVFRLPETGADAELFQKTALIKMEDFSSATYGGIYTDILANIYKVFGPTRMIGQFINVLFWITTTDVFYKIMMTMQVDEKGRRFGLVIMSFAPHYAILNSILLRESAISLMVCTSFYYFVKWWSKKKNILYVLIAIGFCLIAAAFHSGAIAPAIGYLFVVLLYDKKNARYRFNAYTITGIIFAIFAFSYLNNRFGSIFFDRFQRIDFEQRLSTISTGSGGSGYSAGFSISNPIVSAIVNTPIKTLYFWLAPMPWDWRGINDIISFILSSLLYISCYIDILKAIVRRQINREDGSAIIACFFIILSASIVFSWGVSNAGTAIRHRDKFISIYTLMWVVSRKANRLHDQ